MSILVNAENITTYIPQRAPFVMIDNLLEQSKEEVISDFHIQNENIFIEDGNFTISGLLENIAQTAAANVGYECAKQNIPVPLGFIGAISKVKVFNLPKVGSSFNTKVSILQEVFNITLIEGKVSQNGETLVSCQMKIMVDTSSN
jgi:predicted hotdog family 3-hydroxylacyl-ACP dehydratase